MANKFPVYKNHKKVKCFNCGENLKDMVPVISGYDNGEYRKHCPKCAMSTWYNSTPINGEK